ncbi:hypothetical protein MPH_04077 [Macrophomina phaseolina MS6]|uniref:Beta/gamma crystallin n=1 Tax=Macrophomina phaseolina (strain MS6) TaxID=1126212 RepID=K2S137_MACPH|nr:hypothetical protein MPH_04077 [Macrophomina phaseolina MS6]
MHVTPTLIALALSALTLATPIDPLSLPSDEVAGLIPYAADSSTAAPATNSSLRQRGSYFSSTHRVRYCEHASGRGACVNQDLSDEKCYGFMPAWKNRISSFYVNPWTYCEASKVDRCGGKAFPISAPGQLNFKTAWGGAYNDQIKSVKCVSGRRT